MNSIKRKVLVIALAVSLLAIVSMGTLAWFTAKDEVTNEFFVAGSDDSDPDEVFSVTVWEDKTPEDPDGEEKLDKIEFDAILPGDDLYKEVNVENTGSYDQYIRVTVTVTDAMVWQDIFDTIYVPLDAIATDLNSAFTGYRTVFNADDNTLTYVLYYNAVLPYENGDVVTLFTNVHIPEAMDRYQAAAVAGQFDITVLAEAVQTEHVGDNAVAAFATVGMAVEPGEYTYASTGTAFLNLASLINSGVSSEGMLVVLTDDVDLAGVALTPIGTEKSPFKGTFDGANFTVSNSSIEDGMFAYVGEGAVIKNVKFENVSVGGTYSAVVANYAKGATFDNIQVLSGAINVENYGAAIVFEAYDVTIKNCVNKATVEAGYSASGIGAWVYDSTVEGCENYGNVTGGNRAGGICANFSGTMTDCTNSGNVTSTGKGAAGGVVGIAGEALTIEGCTNNGAVTTTADNANASAAGILGQAPGSKGYVIKSCANNGNITAEKSHAAGIVVSLYGSTTVDTCTNSGVISGAKGSADLAAAKGIYGGKNTVQ